MMIYVKKNMEKLLIIWKTFIFNSFYKFLIVKKERIVEYLFILYVIDNIKNLGIKG